MKENPTVYPYYEKTFERHRKDLLRLKNGELKDMRFNEAMGKTYIAIIEQLKHYKGSLANTYIKLEPWQKKVVMILFGWEQKHSSGVWVRRFSKALIYIPKKNGKTLMASTFSIADVLVRGEFGGEVVFVGAKREQAKLAWIGVDKMRMLQPELFSNSEKSYGTINFTKNETTFKAIGRDSESEDGMSCSFGCVDELHAHADSSLVDAVQTSQMARLQPLLLIITTAGFSLSSPLIPEYKYAKQILEGSMTNENYFAFIAEADKDDDPFVESTWKKANPNYGISVDRDGLAKIAKEAQDNPEKLNTFLVKHLNRHVSSAETYIPYDKWEDCVDKEVDLSYTLTKIIGFDLSLSDDFTARASLYVLPGNRYHVKLKCYIPEANIQKRSRELHAPLFTWVQEGYIIATPGTTIDQDYLEVDTLKELEQGDVSYIAYDPHRASHLIKQIELKSGFSNCIMVSQGAIKLSEPTSMLLRLVKNRHITHDDNPVLNWMVANMSILTNAYGSIMPNKSDPNSKIDGVAALINCLALVVHVKEEVEEESVYETRGMRSL